MRTKAAMVKTVQDDVERLDSSNCELRPETDPVMIARGLYESGQCIRKNEKIEPALLIYESEDDATRRSDAPDKYDKRQRLTNSPKEWERAEARTTQEVPLRDQ